MYDVTTLLPVYNGMPYLPSALDSLRNQTLRNVVHYVVDGGSKDGSWEYLRTIDDPRIRLFRCEAGLGRQLQLGLDACDTEFVARMDADDLCLPERFEKQLAFLKAEKDVGLVGTQYGQFAEDPSRCIFPPVPAGHDAIYSRLRGGALSLVHPSIMCRTDVLRRAGGYQFAGSGEDWDMFLRVGEISRLANLIEALFLWRVRPSSVSVRQALHCQRRIAYACDGALRRSRNEIEQTYEEFLKSRTSLPAAIVEKLDCYSLQQYKTGLYEYLTGRAVQGVSRLAWSSLCSPSRTVRWVRRYVQRGHSSGTRPEALSGGPAVV
jgi:glycosyltransferase involved in cell wall biosynthesis